MAELSNPSAAAEQQDEKARARARIGSSINNKWRIDSLLGIGGMASVFACSHRNGSRAAIKLLHSEFGRDAAIRDRFLREGYVANKVEHPGRVAILDDDVTEQDEPFLVMELLEGETLQQLWKRRDRRMPVPEALQIADAMLDTLGAFHKVGIVHRDIKPANIFINKDGVVKVLDFGVARMREAGGDHTRAGTALGTPSFMAPEQAMGLTDSIDGRADIFSVGASLYAILSGQRLHQGRSDNEAFILAATQPAPSLARVGTELPVEVIALVDRALAWDPRNRFADAAAMREEIQRILAGYGVQPLGQQLTRGATQLGMPAVGGPQFGAPPPPPVQQPALAPPPSPGYGQPPAAPQPYGAPAAHTPMPAVAAAGPPEEFPIDENDPAVQRLVDVFRRLERLLPTVRQYGWGHPESDNKLRVAYQGIIEALRAGPDTIYWALKPYSFTHRNQTVWEPTPPFDVVPYNLFAAGVRTMSLRVGMTEAEVKSFCEVLLIDPARDLTPEDDVGTALWERRFQHLTYDVINVFAEGDAADREAFYEEADQVEGVAARAAEEKINRAEAAALNVHTDQAALAASRHAAAALALDPMAKKAIGAQMAMTADRWSERYVEVLADALVDARKRQDMPLVAGPLDSSVRDQVLLRRFDVAFSMHDALSRALEAIGSKDAQATRGELTRNMFGPETLRLLLRESLRHVSQNALVGGPLSQVPVDLDQVNQGLQRVVVELGGEHLDAVLAVINEVHHDGVRQTLFSFLERAVRGREAELAQRMPTLSIDTQRPLLRVLAQIRSAQSVAALQQLAQSPDANLRCEAIACLAQSPEQLHQELSRLAEAPEPNLRSAALRAMAHHQVRQAGPLLVKRVQEPTFNQLSIQERREILSALFSLNATRAEQLAIEIVQKHGLLVDEQLETTRALCAELLGQSARSMEALEAVLQATKRRWWNTQVLRDAATVAAEAIAHRLGRRIGANGEIL
jgi:predicted Ser/Thr protein kinase